MALRPDELEPGWQRHESQSRAGLYFYCNPATDEVRATPPGWERHESRSQPGLFFLFNPMTHACRLDRDGVHVSEVSSLRVLIGMHRPVVRVWFDFLTPVEVSALLASSTDFHGLERMTDWRSLAEERRDQIVAATCEWGGCSCAFPSLSINRSLRRTAWQLLLATTATDVEIRIKNFTNTYRVLRLRSVRDENGRLMPVLLATPVSVLYTQFENAEGPASQDVHMLGVRHLSHAQAPLAAYLWPQLRSTNNSVFEATVVPCIHALLHMSTRTCSARAAFFAQGGAIGMGSFVMPEVDSSSKVSLPFAGFRH